MKQTDGGKGWMQGSWMEGMNSPHDEVDSMEMKKQQCRWNLWDNWIDALDLFDDTNGIDWTWDGIGAHGWNGNSWMNCFCNMRL
jgi:hypothetical protein